MKLKNLLKEAKSWIVKDGVTMRKTAVRSMKALSTLDKAVAALEKLVKKHAGKQNNGVFSNHVKGMRREADKLINGKFYTEWKEYEKTGKAIFGENWND